MIDLPTNDGGHGRNRTALARRPRRRGNAMILVAGILVLLVIIATAYVTRTQSARLTSKAVHDAQTRDNNVEVLADTLASIVSEALFPAPVDPSTALLGGTADSSYARLSLDWNPVRYGVDRDVVGGPDGFPDYPYNFAPYHVVPYTNWPDALIGNSNWPQGVGAPVGAIGLNEGNPFGNPGFGDTRWLRDFEPQRADLFSWGAPGSDGRPESLHYWRHLTNISHPNNGFRICADITDVSVPRLVTDLSVPVEQWLTSIQPDYALHFSTWSPDVTGDPNLAVWYADSNGNGESDFIDRWFDWFYDYQTVYRDPTLIPPNFYHLKDLNGNGVFHEAGELPPDEFVRGSWRWLVNRVLTDTDGDGFTDSFWFLAPTPIERGIRQIVAVSIVDNSAMLNANVATSFWWGDLDFPQRYGTAGETPADLAASGQQLDEDDPPVPSWNVGFFDDHKNFEQYFDYPPAPYYGNTMPLYWRTSGSSNFPQIRWLGTDGWPAQRTDNRWYDRMYALGIFDNPEGLFPTAQTQGPLSRAEERRRYWLYGASQPFAATAGLTPFTTQDELELRMFHGQNYPWVFSRFENTLNPPSFSDQFEYSFIRSAGGYDESTEYLDQLTNTELLYDHRRKLTLFNGARNDLMPPWLRWRWWDNVLVRPDVPAEVEADIIGFPTEPVEQRFFTQAAWKLDLREAIPDRTVNDPALGTYYLHERLPWVLLHALTDGDETGGEWLEGTYDATSADDVRKAAASLTANILARRDLDDRGHIYEDLTTTEIEYLPVPLPEWGTLPVDRETQFLGMERQPFLMEAFIGHVYELFQVPGNPNTGPRYFNSGERLVLASDDSSLLTTTVAVLQIANPFDEPIVLWDPVQTDLPQYEIDFFGQTVNLRDVAEALATSNEPFVLPPAREPDGSTTSRPATMIIYLVDGAFNPGNSTNFGPQWLDFLDLLDTDHPIDTDPLTGDTILVDASDPNIPINWSTSRSTYDNATEGVELVRVDDPLGPTPSRVVIDRFDDDTLPDAEQFTWRVNELNATNSRPETWAELQARIPGFPPLPVDPPVEDFPPTNWQSPVQEQTHWVQWVRVARAWGRDADGSISSDPTERSPRYVYATNEISSSADVPVGRNNGDSRTDRYWGDSDVPGVLFTLANPPDRDPTENLPWFTRDYDTASGVLSNRKPTFFDLNYAGDPANPGWGYPDKGFYHSPYPLQMLQKDDDFDQVGELLNVWLYGHELVFEEVAAGDWEYFETTRTFSEYMADHERDHPTEPRANRLFDDDPPIGKGLASDPRDPLHAIPVLPATMRVLDAFVCDGRGQFRDFDEDGILGDQDDLDIYADNGFANALGFSGRITPGLVNINTAPVEVMRTLPHWNRVVHANPLIVPPARFPRSALPEAVVSYRERYENFDSAGGGLGLLNGPDYKDREPDHRTDRGFATISELRGLTKDGRADTASPFINDPSSVFGVVSAAWKIDFAADEPFNQIFPDTEAAFISTDVTGPKQVDAKLGDGVSGDSEEANLLFSGASNLITTRSDMFTVYFRVRSFRQNPTTQRWDATDPEYIVDDSRYVMLVDRSEVNRPSDKPRVLYLEKLPN